jgi:hypothetical protein
MAAGILSQALPDNFKWWGVVILAMLTMAYAVLRPFKKKKDPLEKAPFSSLAQQRQVEKQMQNVLVELSDMARQISAQLDTRAAKLEAMIREADEKLAQMQAATQRGDHPDSPPPPASEPRHAQIYELWLRDRAVESDPRYAQIYTLADQGRSSQEISKQLGRPSGEIELILALRGK